MRTVLITLAALAALALPATARADQPAFSTMHVDTSITIPADQNICGVDLVFTSLGDLTVKTFSDGQLIAQGILQHTIASPWHTLSSIGPASVHIDLNTGVSTDTGMEFSFHTPGGGVLLVQAGNFTMLPDGTLIERGLDRFSPALCLALAP